MRDVVCGGDPELYEYLICWIAYTFQNPDKPAGSAIVLRGEKGCGKGTLGHFLRMIWGNHGIHISNAKHLIGSFNGHLTDVCFLFADEAFYSGDKAHEGVLKAMVTEPTMMVERKGIDGVMQPNYLKILMATNADHAVPATRDERRYGVYDVDGTYIGNRKYFNALHRDCESEAVQAAFLHAMLKVDLTDWHSGDIPDSKGLRAQRFHSMDSHQHWIVDALNNGAFNASGDEWHEELQSKDLYSSYVSWCDSARKGEYKRVSQALLGKYLGKVFKSLKRAGCEGKRGFYFGSLANAIKKFESYEKVKIDELTS